MEVAYKGILPDLFREGQGIVANGILINGNVIEAS
jgi:cytochrome c-type biogenesis protein CcmE